MRYGAYSAAMPFPKFIWMRWVAIAACALLTLPAQARRLGQIEFTPCELSSAQTLQTLSAECAHYEVAENPEAPEGRRIALNLVLIPARIAKPRSDLVVYLAGGPGQSATESFLQYSPGFQYLLKSRNVLLVDQRGTGGSNRLNCPLANEDLEDEAPELRLRDLAQRCRDALVSRADLRYYTTLDAIRDLETLRHALGEPQYDLVGASYGTRVALTYLQRHPDSLRSVILDGVVPQDVALGQDHARNLDDGLAKIFAACQNNVECAARFGDPAATLRALRDRLRGQPLHVALPDPRSNAQRDETLSAVGLAGVVRLFSYQPEFAALLPLLIDEAAHGRPQALVAQGLSLSNTFKDAFAHGMELSVLCSEDYGNLRPRPEDAERLLGNGLIRIFSAQCPVWPTIPTPNDFHKAVVSNKPVLLLSGEWDPVTPPWMAEQAAKTLGNSRHLVAKGRGHTVLWRGCVPKLAATFVETLQPTALDAGCLDVLGDTPAFISYQGPAP